MQSEWGGMERPSCTKRWDDVGVGAEMVTEVAMMRRQIVGNEWVTSWQQVGNGRASGHAQRREGESCTARRSHAHPTQAPTLHTRSTRVQSNEPNRLSTQDTP